MITPPAAPPPPGPAAGRARRRRGRQVGHSSEPGPGPRRRGRRAPEGPPSGFPGQTHRAASPGHRWGRARLPPRGRMEEREHHCADPNALPPEYPNSAGGDRGPPSGFRPFFLTWSNKKSLFVVRLSCPRPPLPPFCGTSMGGPAPRPPRALESGRWRVIYRGATPLSPSG